MTERSSGLFAFNVLNSTRKGFLWGLDLSRIFFLGISLNLYSIKSASWSYIEFEVHVASWFLRVGVNRWLTCVYLECRDTVFRITDLGMTLKVRMTDLLLLS